MTQSAWRRGPITSAVLSGGLIVCVAGLVICGNADWSAPPRFDGAGYAVLAQAWKSGQGYRAIDHPDMPRHAHFPPGYPLVLALTWWAIGQSATAAHVLSTLFTLSACLAAWCWFRRLIARPAALVLGLALAVNWLWARTGSAILSEPLFMLLSQLTILAFVEVGRRSLLRARDLCVLSLMLAACLLTRHVAIGLVVAVLIDLGLRRRWWQALAIAVGTASLVSPWLAWMVTIGKDGGTQAGLLLQSDTTLARRLALQLAFYVQRIPDQICGPFVEVGTASTRFASLANVWAILTTAVIAGGWVPMVRQPDKSLPALVAVCTLAILVVWPYTEAGRFLIPLIPNLLIGAIEGFVGLAGRFESMPRKPFQQSRLQFQAACLILAASVPYSGYALLSGRNRAQEATHHDFDAACQWIATHADRAGPILCRHPGEVFWQSGRQALDVPAVTRLGEANHDSIAVERMIKRYRIPYLLVDQDRYAQAPTSTLAHFVASHPDHVRKVWERETGRATISIYEVNPDR